MEGRYLHYTIAVGNPFDGVSLYGEFDTPDEANDYADLHIRDTDWHVVPVLKKEELL